MDWRSKWLEPSFFKPGNSKHFLLQTDVGNVSWFLDPSNYSNHFQLILRLLVGWKFRIELNLENYIIKPSTACTAKPSLVLELSFISKSDNRFFDYFTAFIAMYIHYKHVREFNVTDMPIILKLNYWSLWIGAFTCLGLSIVANFQVSLTYAFIPRDNSYKWLFVHICCIVYCAD